MTQPTPYRRGYDFSDAGGAQPPGGPLDGELNNLALTTSQILRNLALLQRDDTALRNGIVGIDALDGRVLGLISGGTFSIAGTWATGTPYPAGAFLTDDGAIYLVMEAHTSTSIVDDLAAGRIAKALQNEQGTRLRDDFIGNAVQTEFSLSQSPARPTDVEVYVDGALVLPDDYVQTGATVTFDVAPANGAKISVFSITWATAPPIQTLVDAVGDRNIEISAATQFLADVGDGAPGKGASLIATEGLGDVQSDLDARPTTAALASSSGVSMIGFLQAGTGAVPRSAEEKLRESVSLEDYYSGDFADAIEAASAVASTVHVYGAAYEIDRIATVAASTDIVLHGTTISATSGNTATHMLTFTGSGSIRGTGAFVGGNLNDPSGTWAGVGVPQGSAIYSAAANLAGRTGHLIIDGAITFRDFPSGPIFAKWRDLVSIKGAIFDNCQTATVQWKDSGSYVNIPGTTNAGTTSSPIGEIITSHNVQAYQCAEARVEGCDIDCYSKGISLNADRAYSLNNTFRYGTSRHTMEHFTGCEKVVRSGNTYDGAEDHGMGSKVVYSTNISASNNNYSDCSFGLYIQDCTGLVIGAENHAGTTASAYGFATTSSVDGRAITDCVINLGSVRGVAGSKVIHIASDSAAVTAGYNFTLDITGGRVSGFDGLIDHATPGIGEVIDLTWKGTEVVGATVAMDLRIRSCDVDLAFRNCTGPLINLGNVTGVSGTTAKVKMVATGCTGAFLLRYANGSVYQGIFQKTSLDISSSGGSPVRAISFSLGASDTLGLLNLDINCTDLTGNGGQAIAFDANSKTFKARVRLTDSNGLNYTFTNAGSMTGVLEKPIAGSITGGALTAV